MPEVRKIIYKAKWNGNGRMDGWCLKKRESHMFVLAVTFLSKIRELGERFVCGLKRV